MLGVDFHRENLPWKKFPRVEVSRGKFILEDLTEFLYTILLIVFSFANILFANSILHVEMFREYFPVATGKGIFSEDGTLWREFDKGGGCTLRWMKFPT